MKVELIDRAEFERRTKYWVEETIYWCPACLSEDRYRSRVLNSERERPEEYNDRHIWIEHWNYCDI